MMLRYSFVLWSVFLAATAAADETRTVTDANGQVWNEVHRTISHPQTQTQCVEQPQTYYQEKCDVQTQDTYRSYVVPVTEYHWESYWVGRFNPFVQPYLAQRLVPRTRWETRTEVVKVPVVQRSLVPVTRMVRVPVTTETVVNQDIVVHRQLVSPTTAIASTPPGDQQALAIGGIQNLNKRPVAATVTTPAAGSAAAFAVAPKSVPRIARSPE
ncbi:MAG TPA: hypothetical protein VFI31_07070 [Pirellulales bacterium]|nr:hypothetical protein [Pirellulales bacterium]